MKRNNQRFNNRIRIRDCGTINERLLYLEKLNMILLRNSVVQETINKELRGRNLTTANHLAKVHDKLQHTIATNNTYISNMYDSNEYKDMSKEVEAISIKLDAMEELLEDMV